MRQGLTVSIAKLEAHGIGPWRAAGAPCAVFPALFRAPSPLPGFDSLRCSDAGFPCWFPLLLWFALCQSSPRMGAIGTPGRKRAGKGARNGTSPRRAAPLPGVPMERAPHRRGVNWVGYGDGRRRQGRPNREPADRRRPAPLQGPKRGAAVGIRRAGEKAAKGTRPRAPRKGQGGGGGPAVRHFFRIPWRVWGPPAAHCGAGPHAGEERGHDCRAAAVRRGRQAGPPTNPPPPGRRAVVPRNERRRPAHGTPPGHQRPDAAVCTPTRSLHLPQRKPPRGPYGACGVRPQRNHGAHARAYWAGEGGRNAPQGVRGATPASEQARAAVRRARERERFSGRAVSVGPSFT
jgi:hypothetical protein